MRARQRAAAARRANLLAAAAIGLTDRLSDLTEVVDVTDSADLDPTAATALVTLVDLSPHGSIRRLSQSIGLTHSGAVRLVSRLVDAGWVQRGPGADGRTAAVTLTAAGRALADRLRQRRRTIMDEAMTGLDERQCDELERACAVIVAHLARQRMTQRRAGRPPPRGALCRLCDFEACGRPAGECPADRAAAGETAPSAPSASP